MLLPIPGGPVLLLDCGANVEVRPEHLVQFAYIGVGFMEAVLGVERPRVGLLSVGEEQGKGTPDVLEAHERLAEGRPRTSSATSRASTCRGAGADVMVTDGFTGNVALKVLEGTSRAVRDAIRDAVRSGPVSTLGGLLIRGRVGGCATSSTRRGRAARSCSGCASPWWSPTARSAPKGIASAVGWPAARWTSDMVERTAAALGPPGPCGPRRASVAE